LTKLLPRHLWLKERIINCLEELKELNDITDWNKYLKEIKILGKELIYAATTWDKYYLEEEKNVE
jgi:hypothetical protein